MCCPFIQTYEVEGLTYAFNCFKMKYNLQMDTLHDVKHQIIVCHVVIAFVVMKPMA
jgi:hypothetical protein